MELYLLRHAIAADKSEPGIKRDADRPLTPEGAEKMKDIAKKMKKMDLSFDLILSSPFRRATETAEIVADVLDCRDIVELSRHLEVGGNPEKLIDQIKTEKSDLDSILLVGHEPYLSGLISMMISGTDDLAVTMKKGGLCKLSTESLRYGKCATLEWLIGPGQVLI
ncbi:MAG TPA: phosphohistidine phosphatase SixA [Candidatus Kryptonia bacterium]